MEFLSRNFLRRRKWLGVLAAVGGALVSPRAWPERPRDYELESVLLFNLTQFVDWPPGTFARAGDPFVIGIVGRDPFAGSLDEVVRNERACGRRIVVTRVRHPIEARSCQLLFVSAGERGELPALLRAAGGRPLLTVGDFENFVRRGGMVEFYRTPENKIRLRVNVEATRAARLTMSSKLLRVAEVRRAEED